MVPLIIFTLLFALALTRAAAPARNLLLSLFQAVAETMLTLAKEQGQTVLPVILPTYGGEAWAVHGIDYASNWHRIVPTAISSSGDAILIAGSDEHDTPGGFILLFGPAQDGPFGARPPAGPQ